MGKILYEANTGSKELEPKRESKVLVSGCNLLVLALYITAVNFAAFTLWGIDYSQLEEKSFVFLVFSIGVALFVIASDIIICGSYLWRGNKITFLQKDMELNNFLTVVESSDNEFDFKSLIKNKHCAIVAGAIPVKIDKVIYDLTGETPLAVSGTLTINGVKMRGNWDALGNILAFRKSFQLFTPLTYKKFVQMLADMPETMFRLVQIKDVKSED